MQKKEGQISDHNHPANPTPAPQRVPKTKGGEPGLGMCIAGGCKAKSHKLSFCDDHFDHFKFGLIKKTGEHVSDYEKKFDHYTNYKRNNKLKKVA